jgi:hypothetical protein
MCKDFTLALWERVRVRVLVRRDRALTSGLSKGERMEEFGFS